MDSNKIAQVERDVNKLDAARREFLSAWRDWLAAGPSAIEAAEELTSTISALVQITRIVR